MKVEKRSQPRQRMAPSDRREAILDAAQGQFMAHGWEAVTVADILHVTGLSKGGFYHHFSGKEDLLAALVQRITARLIAAAQDARARTHGSALARLNAFVGGTARWSADNMQALRVLGDALIRPGNEVLLQRALASISDIMTPILTEMITEGANSGSFEVEDIDLTVEIILGLSQRRRETLARAFAEEGDAVEIAETFEARLAKEGAICDRLLGLPKGSVAFSRPAEFRQLFSSLAGCRP